MHDNSNKILIDWLSITSKRLSAKEMVELLGLESAPWEDGKGYHGYKSRLWYDCISIHYDGTADMGVWLEMSGQGCRAYESYSSKKDLYNTDMYAPLFRFVLDNPEECNITRLDVAFDEFSGLLDGRRVFDDTVNQKYKSKAEAWSATTSSDGLSMNIGSPRSKVLIRIYDKRAERLAKITDADQRKRIEEDIPHWMRVELQLRDDRALEFVKTMAGCGKCSSSPMSIGAVYTGVLANYLDYGYGVPARNNADKLVWHTFPYWQDVIAGAEAISIYSQPGTEYNLSRLENYVCNMAGNAVDALLKIKGMDGFLEKLKDRHIKPNPKYIMLIEDEKRRQEEVEKRRKEEEEIEYV